MQRLHTMLIICALATSMVVNAQIYVGHRGSYTGVMNTAEAYRNGVDIYGFAGLECDVRVSADGQYVISHDETTAAVGGQLTVAESTLQQLQAETYIQTRGDSTYTGHICTVDEYLRICKEKDVFPVIELKWATGINNNDMSNFAGLYALICSHQLERRAIILTSMRSSLEYIRSHYPTLQCQYLIYSLTDERLEWCREHGVSPSIRHDGITETDAARCKAAGLQLAAWTVNRTDIAERLVQWGVGMITSDMLDTHTAPRSSTQE